MFGTLNARHLGPGTTSGRISTIEGVNTNPQTIYVGTAGGGVWKTTNAGASFNPIFDKYCQSIGAIAINQSNPNIVYVGTGESNMRNSVSIGNGLYKSTDAGDNWKKVGLDSTEHISKIVIDPTHPDIIYAAVPGALWCNSKHRGIYKSTDGGDTWEKIFYLNDSTGAADLLINPQHPNILLASMWQFKRQPYSFNSGGNSCGMYKSEDAGKTWKEITNGLPAKPFGRIAMTLSQSEPNNVIAIVENKNTGLYISSDGGNNWKSQSATLNVVSRPFYFSTIVIDPKDSKRVYRPAYTFSYSSDGGYSFTDASNDGGWIHSDMHALWINPNNTNQMYLGTDGGVYYSLDKGSTWLFCQNLPVGQFYHVAYDMQTPYNVYGGLQDNGTWKCPSNAAGGINNARWENVGGGDGFWAQPDPTDPKIVYSESQGGEANRVNMTNMKSESIQPQATKNEKKLRWNWNTPIVIGAKNPHNLYMAAQYLYKSTNHGISWKRISNDLTTNNPLKQKQEESGGISADITSAENHCTIYTLAESPKDENTIWVGTDDGNLQYTTNGGSTWTNVSKNIAQCGIPAQTGVSSIELSSFDNKMLYATFDNHGYGDHATYLAKSTDMGATWKRINSNEFTGFAHKIKEDIVNKNLLFLGTEMGLFASLDAGENWFRMKNNIPEYAMVHDIKIHPKSNDLIIATHGRGIIIVDDISPMRNLTKDIAAQDAYLFNTPDLVLKNGNFGYGGPQNNAGWRTDNANSNPSIIYYLKNRLNAGNLSCDILDANGKLVQNIIGSKHKGINKIDWNLHSTPPKAITGSSKVDYSGFNAPMVLPGIYTIKLKINDKEYNNTVRCVADSSNNFFSDKDRKTVHENAMKLLDLYNHINGNIDTINQLQSKLASDSVAFKTKKVSTFYQSLEKVKASLTATKQTSIFADEEQLREKVSKLYSTFCYLECTPSNLQLEAIPALQDEYKAIQTQLNAFVAEK